ncbi:MAG: hypothetical protein KDC35_10105 [Acidobacteria bacterium]|nr:hypothetical protein [Acidobacteriota bacterium]
MRWLALPLALLTLACAGDKKAVRIDLPLPPKLDLSEYDAVYFSGFISTEQNREFDTVTEAINFFKNEFAQRDNIDTLDRDPVDLSEYDPREFFEGDQPFFGNLDVEDGDRVLTVTGVVNFEVLDRSGFRQVQATDISGQSYYRTQFVEMTGYVLRMRVYVYELGEGKLLFKELMQDEIDVEGPPGDTRLAFYTLLERMSDRVIGLFANTKVRAERTLL